MTDILLRLLGEDAASSSLHSVKNALHNLGKTVYEFSRDAVKAFEEQEKADRRLALAAKDLTEAFKAQASQLQATLGVSDDMVQGIQAMLLQFGEAPSQVEATTRAILDFSAATGEDATSAAKALLSGVESGKAAFKEYGVQVNFTGKASADLATATAELARKFGGAAKGDADSLTGQVDRAKAAFGELQESWGGVVSEFLKSTGILERVTTSMAHLSELAHGVGSKGVDSAEGQKAQFLAIQLAIDAAQQGQPVTIDGQATSLDALLKQRADLRLKYRPVEGPIQQPGGLGKKDRPTRFGEKEAAKNAQDPTAGDMLGAMVGLRSQDDMGFEAGFLADWDDVKSAQSKSAQAEKETQALVKAEREKWQRVAHERAKAAKEAKDHAAQQGGEVGAALVNAFAAQIDKLGQGGELDAGAMFADILGTILQVGGALLGGIVGPGGAAIGGALGGLAASGVRGLSRLGKQHTGGWIGAPRFHSGGWPGVDEVPAVLQSGERVLSRSEVSAMGGPSGVESAARGRGGGGVTINVSAIDSRSSREYFEGDGARAMLNARRTGRGDLGLVLAGA